MHRATSSIRRINEKDLFRIDWQQAVKEASDYMNIAMKSKDFDTRLNSVIMFEEINDAYRGDDAYTYLGIIDKNRHLLKGSVVQ